MNPSPTPPVQLPPWLADRRTTPPASVPATIIVGFPPRRLAAVERSWTPARDQLAREMAAAGRPLESRHWRWTRKDAAAQAGDLLLVAVECRGRIQGLMALKTKLRPSGIDPGRWVMYVDYIESAPWNLNVPGIQEARYGRVGLLLIAQAVRVAAGRTVGGRIGLHSLPQTEGFYANQCRMTRVGPDSAYQNLVYFEYRDGDAKGWLTDMGFSV